MAASEIRSTSIQNTQIRSAAPWLLLLLLLAFAAWKLHTSHFDWNLVRNAWHTANLWYIAAAILVIEINYLLRAWRWAIFLKPAFEQAGARPVHWWSLVGPQLVGFTGLAIFGRIGELIRPLLVARRTGLTFSSQVAVVTVERVFDLGAFALIFSLNLLFSPALQALPYLHKAGLLIAALTVCIGLFVAVVWFSGERVAQLAERLLGPASKKVAEAVAHKIRAFRSGLNVIASFRELLQVAAVSLALWAVIATTYFLTLRAFPPPVHALGASEGIILLGFSVAGSALPIPGGGGAWAGVVFALSNLFHIPVELAGLTGLMLWSVSTLSVIPLGLLFAKIEGISISATAKTTAS